MSKVCSQIVLKCLYLARMGRHDILWSIDKLERAVRKWTRACDKRLARSISYIHNSSDHRQYCHSGNTALSIGIVPILRLSGDLEDLKSTSGGILCILRSRTFVPTSWMCKKRTSVSHSSTESEVVSLDAGLRMDGIPALDLWDVVVELLHVPSNQPRARSNLLRDKHCEKHSNARTKNSSTSQKIVAGQMLYVTSRKMFSLRCLALYF